MSRPLSVSSGRYDWESRDTLERRRFMAFLEKIVVGKRQAEDPDVFAMASPLRHVGAHAPPFFVIHGRSDAIIPVRQARAFVERLRHASNRPVAYAELPGTGHGFDIVDPFRAKHGPCGGAIPARLPGRRRLTQPRVVRSAILLWNNN